MLRGDEQANERDERHDPCEYATPLQCTLFSLTRRGLDDHQLQHTYEGLCFSDAAGITTDACMFLCPATTTTDDGEQGHHTPSQFDASLASFSSHTDDASASVCPQSRGQDAGLPEFSESWFPRFWPADACKLLFQATTTDDEEQGHHTPSQFDASLASLSSYTDDASASVCPQSRGQDAGLPEFSQSWFPRFWPADACKLLFQATLPETTGFFTGLVVPADEACAPRAASCTPPSIGMIPALGLYEE